MRNLSLRFGVLRLVAALYRFGQSKKSKAVTSHRTPYGGLPRSLCLTLLLLTTNHSSAEQTEFSTHIKPFLDTYCVFCHGQQKAKAKLRVDRLSGKFDDRKEAEWWGRILEALEFGEMPSEKAKKFPTKEEVRLVMKWIGDSLSHQGVAIENKSDAEGFGNLVPHDLLFSPAQRNRPIDVAARIWRISPKTLEHLLRAGGRARIISNPFALDKPDGNFRDFKGKYQLNSLMAEQVAELALEAAKGQVRNNEGHLKVSFEKGMKSREVYQPLLIRQFQAVLRRTPTEKELQPLLAMLEKVDGELGRPRGLQAAYAAIILQPESLFRYETEEPVDPKHGLVALSHRELARSLAFALTDLPPPNEVLKAFEQKEMPVKELLQSEAQRLLNKDRNAKARLLQFFQEYFDYEKANDIFKDPIKGHRHSAPALVNDFNRLVEHTLEKDKQVFKTLLTTQEYFILVNSHKDYGSPLAYNLSPDWKSTTKPVRLPKQQRMGVLTHPAWLIAHSGNFDNDPIRRGKWIRYKLLGGTIPDIPINVDAKLPDDKTMTLRERMHVTRVDECYKCHSKMNSLGLPFERYDHYGRFRFEELKKPVDTSGGIKRSGVTELDGDVKTPFEMIERLARSEHVEQVFVRHVFRFFMGRNETLGDAKTLQDAHRTYVDSDGSMKALVVSLLTSDSFIYRKPRPKPN